MDGRENRRDAVTRPATQAERLTRIETLLEAEMAARAAERAAMREKVDEIAVELKEIRAEAAAEFKALRAEIESVKTEQTALKSKGLGFLAGAGLAGGSVVAGLLKLFGG